MALPSPDDLRVLSLCSGIGGLDLGIRLALGGRCRTVGYVEREAYAAAVLVARMEEEALDPAPVWDDLSTFDGRPWRGRVDLVTGGYPCQPFSLAGARKGADDPRHLWPHVRRIVEEVRPVAVFFENVAGHVSLGLEAVVSDLEGMDYRVAAGLFTAEEVGAPHRRERVFILGQLSDAVGGGCGRGQEDEIRQAVERAALGHAERARRPQAGTGHALDAGPQPVEGSQHLEHSPSKRCGEGRTESAVWNGWDTPAPGTSGAVAHSQRNELRHEPGRCGGPDGPGARQFGDAREGMEIGGDRGEGDRRPLPEQGLSSGGGIPARPLIGHQGSRSPEQLAHTDIGRRQGIRRGGLLDGALAPSWPPGPADADGWRAAPAEAQPAVRRVADGPPLWLGTARADRLRALGNGVVPQQAALALRTLIEALTAPTEQ